MSTAEATEIDVASLPYHEVVHLFPPITGESLEGFEKSIRNGGIKLPVAWWTDPKTKKSYIIDGRNRVEVFKKLKAEEWLIYGNPIDLPTWEFKGNRVDMLGYVMQLNRDKRDLSSGQRAAISVKAAYLGNTYSAGRKKDDEKIAEMTAAVAGTNRTYVFDCQKLYLEAPDLLDEVISGKMNIPEAKKTLQKRRDEAAKTLPSDLAPKETVSETTGAVAGDTVSAYPPGEQDDSETVTEEPVVEKRPIVYDAIKKPVPDDLVPVFVNVDKFHAIQKTLRATIKEAEALAEIPGGEYLHLDEIKADLKRAVENLGWQQPYTTCPHCSATGVEPGTTKETCKICHGYRWVDKSLFKLLSKQAKEESAEVTEETPAGEPVAV